MLRSRPVASPKLGWGVLTKIIHQGTGELLIVPSPVRPKKTKTEALACMAVDVLTLLTVIITGTALLLAQSRCDA